MSALKINPSDRRCRGLIGVGGIGSGQFFALRGNATLGREESRGGHFINRRDYCKLHIIAHYVKRLMGPDFDVTPIGFVGDDPPGASLIQEMIEVGFNLDHVRKLAGVSTLFSFCFVYPDGSGGNMTTDDSACARLTGTDVEKAEKEFRRLRDKGILVAVPEVSLGSRAAALELATKYGLFRATSFTAGEIVTPEARKLIRQSDFLAINLNEAAAFCELEDGAPAEWIVKQTFEKISGLQPRIWVAITGGAAGSWCWNGKVQWHLPVCPVEVAGTSGAGDAFFAGFIAGWAAGLDPSEAQELANLNAALSVTSVHTIHPGIDRATLRKLAEDRRCEISRHVQMLLEAD
jgi:ribokinase